MAGLVPLIPRLKFTDSAGKPLAMGWVTVYLAGTTTLATVYQDVDLTVPQPNPVHLDIDGSALFWLPPDSRFKFLLQTSALVTVPGYPVDNIPGAASGDLAGAIGATSIGYRPAVSGGVLRTLAAVMDDIINVKNFGAIADGGSHQLAERFSTLAAAQVVYPFATALTNQIDWCAFQAALFSVPVGLSYSKTVHFPGGRYLNFQGLTAPGRNVVVKGDGEFSSVLLVAANITALTLDATGCANPCLGMMDFGVIESGSMPTMTGVAFQNSQDVFLKNVFVTTSGRALRMGSNGPDVTFSMVDNFRFECGGGMEAIRFHGGGGVWTNVLGRKARTAGKAGPTFWLTGQTTALVVSNSNFGGKGTARSIAITAISAGAGFFDVGVPANPYMIGEPIVILGTGTGYDRVWKVDSKPNVDTVRILQPDASLGNVLTPLPGSSADKLHACLYMDNSLGAVNETQWDNVIFEGIENGSWVGSCSVYADTSGSPANAVLTHQFTGCTYDAGHNSIVILGRNIGGGDTLVRDFRFTGGIFRYSVNAIWLLGAKGVHITNMSGDCHRLDSSAPELIRCAALYLDTAAGEPCAGIKVSNSTFGRQPDWTVGGITSFSPDHGMRINGVVQDIHFTGCHFYGQIGSVLIDNSFIDASSRIMDVGCTYGFGLSGESTAGRIPTLASAATIPAPFGDCFTISGTTAITTIQNGWVGRRVDFITTAALTFNTGGNIANTLTTVAGQLVSARHDGTNWHLR